MESAYTPGSAQHPADATAHPLPTPAEHASAPTPPYPVYEQGAAPVTGPEPGPKPQTYVVEGNFHAALTCISEETGEPYAAELVLRTKIPYKTFKKLTAMSEGNSLEDLELFVDAVGVGPARQVMEDCDDTITLIAVAAEYFQIFNEMAEARLGESGLSLSS